MKTIGVHASWANDLLLGHLRVSSKGRREVCQFEASAEGGDHLRKLKCSLDPDIAAVSGAQFPRNSTFGAFEDCSPDRWGRVLMKRRHERQARLAGITASPLQPSDYLLGVHDPFRQGGLRFRVAGSDSFLDDDHIRPVPKMVDLGILLRAAQRFEQNDIDSDDDHHDWLKLLIAPGASLGGARPKASVMHKGQLMIAKFPSIRDEIDVGAWEHVAMQLASACGLRTAPGMIRKIASPHHTFLTTRFDRTPTGNRIHFASAMTLSGHVDGDNADSGASYLELVDIICSHGLHPSEDLAELWSRIVFNMLISNTDDHLRNHGFILDTTKGAWTLSPLYDVNPDPLGTELSLNVDESDNLLDLDLALSVCKLFRVPLKTARERISSMKQVVASWANVASQVGLTKRECEQMQSAFSHRG